ncbi:MAG: hypothetical protein HGA35_04630, partial [Erysipelotrichaceae bacterium]|nr:hypothetical protein [Erysipelotrichaceae bacterium]
TQQLFTSKTTGTSSNAIVTTTTLANYSFAAGTFASGTLTTGKIMTGVITFSAVATTGERYIDMGDITFSNGLLCVIAGTAADLTILYN